jgi:hypothetical protein
VTVDYTKPIEIFKGERVLKAWVAPGYNGAGPVPIEWEGALEATSVNALMRMGWTVRNV